MSEALRVTTRGTRSAIVVAVAGRVDLAGEAPLREQVIDACEEQTVKRFVVVDLTEVSFLSVGSAPLFLRAHYHCLHRGKLLRVAVGPGPALTTLMVTGIQDVVAVYPDLASALANEVNSPWQ
ncbi:STAS domain-containing protein [Actinokineospora sp. G85]|uniref:STAS domain-containing protein n=1 Tax=Actinokineospora sp. G85 TaxID=3406626 RepID=UPI003C73ED1D